MQKGHHLEFTCQKCQHTVKFSVLQPLQLNTLRCENCQQNYQFTDENLNRQLHKFESLCRQIQESEEILGDTSVGIDVGGHQVKVPYKILLARLNPTLNLKIGDKSLDIRFRIEPIKDVPSNKS